MSTGYDHRDELKFSYAPTLSDVKQTGNGQESNDRHSITFHPRLSHAAIHARAELAVVESRDKDHYFRSMIDALPIMIWASDSSGKATYLNRKWLEFTGSKPSEVIEGSWADCVHPEDVENFLQSHKHNSQEKKPFQIEYRLRRHDGEYQRVVNAATPHFSNGIFDGYVNSCNYVETKCQEIDPDESPEVSLAALDGGSGDILGQSKAIKNIRLKIKNVASTDSTVLIMGETGTGKELIARAIHTSSSRKDERLVIVNCAALTANLIESELFGHEKGAFTGAANRKQGRFEIADGGTIFLDEIGELPLDLQAKLLRVLEESEFERVGGTVTIKTNVRIIAATNRNLQDEVRKGTFRSDLWYRLNVFQITSPPLRERLDDVPVLVKFFVGKVSAKIAKPVRAISPAAMTQFCNYAWPGNVRELANVVERAVIMSHGEVLELDDHFDFMKEEVQPAGSNTLQDLEREHIARVLKDCRWRVEGPGGAARVLGLNPSTLRNRMTSLGIRRPIPRMRQQ